MKLLETVAQPLRIAEDRSKSFLPDIKKLESKIKDLLDLYEEQKKIHGMFLLKSSYEQMLEQMLWEVGSCILYKEKAESDLLDPDIIKKEKPASYLGRKEDFRTYFVRRLNKWLIDAQVNSDESQNIAHIVNGMFPERTPYKAVDVRKILNKKLSNLKSGTFKKEEK